MTELKHSQNRNYGIDALRIYAMFLVVILHVLGQGGILSESNLLTNKLAWLLETWAYCAVNIYAIISGYVAYSDVVKPLKTSKFLSIWSLVFTYSFGITFCAFLIKPQVIGIKSLIRTAFPIATNQYWYFSCYVVVMLFAPWLNRLLSKLNKSEATKLTATIIATFSVFTLFATKLSSADSFVLAWGYSSIWLVALYIIGAWMKKCNVVSRIKTGAAWIVIILLTIITWVLSQVLPSPFKMGGGTFIHKPHYTAYCDGIRYCFCKMATEGKDGENHRIFCTGGFWRIHNPFAIFNLGSFNEWRFCVGDVDMLGVAHYSDIACGCPRHPYPMPPNRKAAIVPLFAT